MKLRLAGARGPWFRRPGAILALVALAVTILTGFLALHLELAYQKTHVFTYDSVSYLFHHAVLAERVERHGRLAVAWHEALTNLKSPLRTVPLVLLAPGLLRHPGGHLATALPMLAVFLTLFGWTIHRRTGDLPYAAAALLLFAMLPGMLHPEIGLAAYWLDLHAAFLVGAASCCLLLADGEHRRRGLAGFAVFAAAAALARYVSAGALAVLCGPLLVAGWARRKAGWRAAGREALLIGLLLGALSGPFLVSHLPAKLRYVDAFSGAELGAGSTVAGARPAVALEVQGNALKRLLSPRRGAPLLAVLFVLELLPWKRPRRAPCGFAAAASGFAAALWLAFGHLLVLIFVLRSTQYLAAVYALPGILLLTLAPRAAPRPRAWLRTAAVAAAALALGTVYVRGWLAEAQKPGAEAADDKRLSRQIAAEIDRLGGDLVVEILLGGHTGLPELLEVHRATGGRLPLPAGAFSSHLGPWRARYPGRSDAEVARAVVERLHRDADLVVVHAGDGSRPAAAFHNETSRAVAFLTAAALAADESWEPAFELTSVRQGRVVGYRNRAADPRAYERILGGASG